MHPLVMIVEHIGVWPLLLFEFVSKPKNFDTLIFILDSQPLNFLVAFSKSAASKTRARDIYKKAGDEYSNRKRRKKRQHSSDKSLVSHNFNLKNFNILTANSANPLITPSLSYTLVSLGQSLFSVISIYLHYRLQTSGGRVALMFVLHYNSRFTCETMIAFLSGKLLEKQTNTAIVDVGGVGYEVSIPLSTFYDLGDVGSDVSLRIYTHVREDAIQLFGFKTLRERDLYLKLISVQGIGPKSGIAMLSGMSADEIIMAIRGNDLARLKSIPGVGLKTAERLVIELRDKVGEMSAGGAVLDAASRSSTPTDAIFEDALSALVNLGYQKNSAEKALNLAAGEGTEISVQKLLRRSLQLLAK